MELTDSLSIIYIETAQALKGAPRRRFMAQLGLDYQLAGSGEHPVSANRLPQYKRFLLTQALADNPPIQNPKSKIQNGMLPRFSCVN